MKHNFKSGDKVRIIDHRPADVGESPHWVTTMDEYIDETGVVVRVEESYILVEFDDGECWCYKPEWISHAEDGITISTINHIQSTMACLNTVSPSIFQKSPAVSATLLRPKKLLTNIKLE